MTLSRTLAGALLLMAVTAAPARADGLIIPFFGVNYGGDSGKDFSNAVDAKRYNWGVSFAFMGGGVFGAEGDFSYSPDFYGKTDAGGSNVMTAMGNLVVGIPLGGQRGFGIRPYGLVGFGVMRSNADFGDVLDLGENNIAWSSGGGVIVFFANHVGVRFDFRYLRTFDDLEILDVDVAPTPEKLDFTRSSLGLVLRF